MAIAGAIVVPIKKEFEDNLKKRLNALNGVEVQGAGDKGIAVVLEGEDSNKLDLKGRTAIVMGSEGTGMSKIVRENCDAFIRIPTNGHVDSLNVSVASGILMYEVRRQQNL